MIRANGYALLTGRRAAERAREGAAKVRRSCREVLLLTEALEPVGRSFRGERVILAYALEGSGYPVLHGFADGVPEPATREPPDGEYSCLGRDADGNYVARDVLGTRGLYQDGTGSVASDHRFLGPDAKLIPAGSTIRVPSGGLRRVALNRSAAHGGLEEAAGDLARLLERSVALRVRGLRRVAVSFSGGLDSALVALLASKKCEVVLCSAFVPSSRDETQSRRAADILGLEYVCRSIGDGMVKGALKEIDLPFQPTGMDRALWCLYSTTSRLASENGSPVILLGQLADELFGGYMKYSANGWEAEDMMERDLLACTKRAFIRDEAACSRWAESRFPFADRSVAELALGLPLAYKIADGERKVVLRKAAGLLGLPESLVGEPKKAAQYSSGLLKLVERYYPF